MRTYWRVVSVIALAACVLLGAAALTARPAQQHAYFGAQRVLPEVVAHRGGAALRPENTLEAFVHAAALGADVVEMDIRRTADGALVCIHDARVDRTTNGSGAVNAFTLARLQKLDAAYHWSPDGGRTYPLRGTGVRVPELGAVFSRLPATRMNIEIKRGERGAVRPLCELVKRYAMTDKVLVASFDHETMLAFREACPDVASSLSGREARVLYAAHRALLSWAYSPDGPSLQIPDRLGALPVATPELIRAARRHGLRVYVWTINDELRTRQLAGIGVDGIITDRPDYLLRLLRRGKRALQ